MDGKKKARPEISESDRLMRLIMQSGAGGIAEGDLKARIDLPRESIDQLVAGLLGLGLVVVTGQYGQRVFRPTNCRAARLLWQ